MSSVEYHSVRGSLPLETHTTPPSVPSKNLEPTIKCPQTHLRTIVEMEDKRTRRLALQMAGIAFVTSLLCTLHIKAYFVPLLGEVSIYIDLVLLVSALALLWFSVRLSILAFGTRRSSDS